MSSLNGKISSHVLDKDDIVRIFTETTGENPNVCFCKVCGELLVNNETVYMKQIIRKGLPIKSTNDKHTFLHTKVFNGHVYRRCVCDKCIKAKYPEYKGRLCQQSAFYLQYAYGVNKEDFDAHKAPICKRTLENYIAGFGEELGRRKFDAYCKKQSAVNTFEYKHRRYGWSEDDFKEYNKSRAVTLKNLCGKYGTEEGTRRYAAYQEKQRFTCTEEYFIKTYGETEGKSKFRNFEQSRLSGINVHSVIAAECLNRIAASFPGHNISYYDGKGNTEKHCGLYALDYYDVDLNVVIEFHGDFWHMNPKLYSPDDTRTGNITAKDVWLHDRQKKDYVCRTLCCRYIIIWESDYRDNPEQCIADVIAQI